MALSAAKLKALLLNTGLQQKDNPLYQVIYELIGSITSLQAASSSSSGGGGGSSTIENKFTQFFTDAGRDENGYNELLIPGPIGPTGPAGANGLNGFMIGMDGNDGADGFLIPAVSSVNPLGVSLIASPVITISHTQILAGADLADVIAAPGAGITLVPVFAYGHGHMVSGYAAARSISMFYSITAGGGGGASSIALTTLNSIIRNIAGDFRYAVPFPNTASPITGFTGTNDCVNKSIYLSLGPANASGNAGNFVTIQVVYYLQADI